MIKYLRDFRECFIKFRLHLIENPAIPEKERIHEMYEYSTKYCPRNYVAKTILYSLPVYMKIHIQDEQYVLLLLFIDSKMSYNTRILIDRL